jgi:hypothetical protein
MLYILALIAYFSLAVASYFAPAHAAEGFIIGAFIIGGTFLIIGIVCQLIKYYIQAEGFEEIKELNKDKDSYEREAEHLIQEFKLYLADIYPQHEKMIFENIKPENVTAYMIKYPDIKTNETLVKLCNEIARFVGRAYGCERRIFAKEREIAVRQRTIWLTSLPILPKD